MKAVEFPSAKEVSSVFVISRTGDAVRRALFQHMASESQIQWVFQDAAECLDGISYEASSARIVNGRELTESELGCYSSHFGIWEQFLASSNTLLTVLEDDVVLDWDFLRTVAQAISTRTDPTLLKLFVKHPTRFNVRGSLCGRYLLEYLDYSGGTQAYIPNRPAAQRLVSLGHIACRPIDDYLDASWEHGIPCFGVFPSPAFERLLPSTIGFRDIEVNASTVERGFRLVRRYSASLKRLVLYFKNRPEINF